MLAFQVHRLKRSGSCSRRSGSMVKRAIVMSYPATSRSKEIDDSFMNKTVHILEVLEQCHNGNCVSMYVAPDTVPVKLGIVFSRDSDQFAYFKFYAVPGVSSKLQSCKTRNHLEASGMKLKSLLRCICE